MEDFDQTINFEDKIKLLVKQLTIECPMGDAKQDCPLAELRKLPLEEKLVMVDSMSAKKLNELLQHHYDCFESRNK